MYDTDSALLEVVIHTVQLELFGEPAVRVPCFIPHAVRRLGVVRGLG